MARDRWFGEIPNIPVGTSFPDRASLSAAGVHRPTVAGISGAAAEGADSIVLNGGYEDDLDQGEEIIYTGHGGNDPKTGKQTGDQMLMFGNRALARSCIDGLPVRVIRGWKNPSDFSPPAGYRYDGIYYVKRYWSETGRSGYKIWRFHLVRDDPTPPPWRGPESRTIAESPSTYTSDADRRAATVQRLVRSTAVTQRVKEIHEYRCQVCGIRLETAAGPYAEGAHIQPLERPHNGPDELANILCLCPNHHVLLDTGGIFITPDLVVLDTLGEMAPTPLRTVHEHAIGQQFLAYHRRIFGREKVARAGD